MTKVRFLVLGLVGATALALASPALASHTLVVTPSDYNVNGAGTTTLRLAMAETERPIAKITIYAPLGWASPLSETAGTTIGQARALVVIKSLAGAKATVEGAIVADDPAKYTTNPAAVQCAGAVRHDAVWLLNLSLQGQSLQVPVFVDRVAQGPETGFASFKLQVCFASPDVPPSQGGQSVGAMPIEMQLTLNSGVFRNPSTNGTYSWRALVTPYNPGTATANPALTEEVRSLVLLPTQLTLAGRKVIRKVGKRRLAYATLNGTLTQVNAGVAGRFVRILANGKRVATVSTNASGVYRVTLRLRARTTYTAQAVIPVRDAGATGCASPLPGTAGCTKATVAPATVAGRGRVTLRP